MRSCTEANCKLCCEYLNVGYHESNKKICVLILLDYTSIWSYAKMLFVIQNCVKSLLRKDEKHRTCKRIVVKIKAIALMNSLFCRGMKLLSRGKSILHAFTQNIALPIYHWLRTWYFNIGWTLNNSTRLHNNALAQGLQTTARGPNPTPEAMSSGPQSQFVNNEKVMHLWKICWFGRM